MQKVNPDLGTEAFGNPMALVWAALLYPNYGILLTLVDTEDHPFGLNDKTVTIKLFINSKHHDQRVAANKALTSLMDALNIKVPDLSKQPPQVVAATYARLLQQRSWYGWLFSTPPAKLTLLKVNATQGISQHHQKHYVNYTFNSANEEINRKDTLIHDFVPLNVWWYQEFLRPKPILNFPTDGLLWKDKNGNDRGDIADANMIARSLGISNKKLLQALFYEIKFEMADVLTFDRFHRKLTANLPRNIFRRQPGLTESLTGEMVAYFRIHGERPSVDKIYKAGIAGELPNQAWNGKWMNSPRHPNFKEVVNM